MDQVAVRLPGKRDSADRMGKMLELRRAAQIIIKTWRQIVGSRSRKNWGAGDPQDSRLHFGIACGVSGGGEKVVRACAAGDLDSSR